MDIVITSSGLRYGRLSVELPFNYILNLRGVGFNLWLHPRMVRRQCTMANTGLGTAASLTQHGVGLGCIPDPAWGGARTCPGPIWSWARTRPDLTWSWERNRPTPNLELGGDALQPKLELDTDVPLPNLELGEGTPWPNVKLDAKKDTTPFWVVTFVLWLLNEEVFLENHDPSICLFNKLN